MTMGSTDDLQLSQKTTRRACRHVLSVIARAYLSTYGCGDQVAR